MIEQTLTRTRRERRLTAEAEARRAAKTRAAKTGRKVGVVLGTSGLILTTSVAAMAEAETPSEGRAQSTLSVETAGNVELAAHAAPSAVAASTDVQLTFDRPAVSSQGSSESAEASSAAAETEAQPNTAQAAESSTADVQTESETSTSTAEVAQTASTSVEAEPAAPAANSSVISAAYSAIGTPYLWAGSTLGGMDCSGFINWAYAQAGQPLPGNARSTHGMMASFPRVSSPQPGDIVVVSGIRSQYHAGIYVGNGQMIGALAASGVTTHGYNEGWHNVVAILRPY